jgi:hypothetical protein
MRMCHLLLTCGLCWPAIGWSATDARLDIPNFEALAQKATESVNITLDANLLGMAARFMDGNDPQDAATKEVIKGLRGIYVRSFTFDKDADYSQADIDAVRRQLNGPGWIRLVQTRSKKTNANVDIYLMVTDKQAQGLALISSEPRSFTIVNIIGAIDLDKLRKLEGQFGVPKIDLDAAKAPAIDKTHVTDKTK